MSDAAASRPTRPGDAQEYRLGDELLIYMPSSGTAYALNRSAKAIWELCDGTRRLGDISRELGQYVGHSEDALLPDVIEGVSRLRELGLLDMR